MAQQLDYEFTLPIGYVDGDGHRHRQGRMRLATALDEVEAVAYPRVQANEAYLSIALLSRVITRLGELQSITPEIVEDLYVTDVAYLEDLYLRLNSYEGQLVAAVCPHCGSALQVEVAPLKDATLPLP